jgi:diaminopimelate decarboxylase
MNVWLQRTADEPELDRQLQSLLRQHDLSAENSSVMVHNLAKLRARMAVLEQAFPSSTLHTVAIKANPIVAVLKEVVQYGFGLEAASSGEVELALAAGCAADKIVFDSPAKTRGELSKYSHMGCVLNANSEAELAALSELRLTSTKPLRLGLRCNPVVADSSRESTTMVATRNSKFGVPIERVPGLLECFPIVNGLHIHVGSQVVTEEELVEATRRVVGVAQRHSQIEWLDIGGGLPTRYRRKDPGLLPTDYYQRLLREVPGLSDYPLITEMGRSIQAGCGWAASRVEYVDEGRIIIHLGADFALRECYQQGHWFHEFELFSPNGRRKRGDLVPMDIYGPLCFAGDRLATGFMMPKPRPGDILVVHDCGAYTLGMWSRYCSRTMPAVLGFDNGLIRVLRPRETVQDIVEFWS